MKKLTLIIALLHALCIFSQVNTDSIANTSIEARIFDGTTMKPIPYCKIYSSHGEFGTLSTTNGYFKLENIKSTDTLVLSFIGYYKKYISGHELSLKDTLFLYPSAIDLNEVVVFSDNAFLYDLIINSKKKEAKESLSAKTYFSLNSTINDQQVELVEAYYNGTFLGYNIQNLELKVGRIALAAYEQRLFISTETSTAINMQQLFNENIFYPKSPFDFRKSDLKKQYLLQTSSFFINEQLQKIYAIDFTPRDTSGIYFSGTVWIDSVSNLIHKINYKIADAKIHPFALIAGSGTILSTDIEITKTFVELNGKMYFNSIDFNYVVKYKRRGDSVIQTVSTNSILYAYSYQNSFSLPFFEFTDGMYGDYMKILASPYNDFFWRNISEFKLSDYKNKNDNFYTTHNNNNTFSYLFKPTDSTTQQFEKPYIPWSEKRVVFREDLQNNIATKNIGSIPSEFYNLKAQLYLDVNVFADTLHFITATIFDPYKTFYYFPINNLSLAFINIYFDIMEIQCRELNIDLQKIDKNVKLIPTVYAERIKTADYISQLYFKEVDRGNNYKALVKWNNLVKEKLNIDNIFIFQISDSN